MKYRFQCVVLREQFLCERAVLILVKIRVAERFDGWGEVDRFHVVLHVEIEGGDVIPESGLCKYCIHALIAVIVDAAHEIGRDADLNTVELRGFQHFVQCVGDQMFTSARGRAAAGDLVCDAAHGEGVEQFL